MAVSWGDFNDPVVSGDPSLVAMLNRGFRARRTGSSSTVTTSKRANAPAPAPYVPPISAAAYLSPQQIANFVSEDPAVLARQLAKTAMQTLQEKQKAEQLEEESKIAREKQRLASEEAYARRDALRQRQFDTVRYVAINAPELLDTAAARNIDRYTQDTGWRGSACADDLIGVCHKTGYLRDGYHADAVDRIERATRNWSDTDHAAIVRLVDEHNGIAQLKAQEAAAAKLRLAAEARQADLGEVLAQIDIDDVGGNW